MLSKLALDPAQERLMGIIYIKDLQLHPHLLDPVCPQTILDDSASQFTIFLNLSTLRFYRDRHYSRKGAVFYTFLLSHTVVLLRRLISRLVAGWGEQKFQFLFVLTSCPVLLGITIPLRACLLCAE